MTKPPTAEEVLGLWQTYRTGNGSPESYLRFHNSFLDWHKAQGPVTRKWFVERFGGEEVKCQRGAISFWYINNEVGVTVSDSSGDCIEFHNPIRSDIERLVRLLGGETCT